MKTTPDDM